jgi:uncharacterized membrane protein
MALTELFVRDNSSTVMNLLYWSPVMIVGSALLSFVIFIPFLIYSSLVALPMYRFFVPRMRIRFSLCSAIGICLTAPIPVLFGQNDAFSISLFALAGLLAGGFFYWFDQVAPAR